MICSDIELLCALLPGLLSEHFSNVLPDTSINLSPAIGKLYTQYVQDLRSKLTKPPCFVGLCFGQNNRDKLYWFLNTVYREIF